MHDSENKGAPGGGRVSIDSAMQAPAGELVGRLYQAHALELVRLALLLLGDQPSAEDVVQDAFLAFQRSLGRLRDPAKALPYLRACVVNGCRSVQRSRGRVADRTTVPAPPVWSAEAAAMASEDRRSLLAAVASLPERAREVLAFRYFLDLPDSEIAAALGVSRSTVSSTASRALAVLARKLEENS
jgi:RNA polymerase sigma factor (sigma-70 family)